MARYLKENMARAEKIRESIKRCSSNTRTIELEDMAGTLDDMAEACRRVGLKVTDKKAYSITVTL